MKWFKWSKSWHILELIDRGSGYNSLCGRRIPQAQVTDVLDEGFNPREATCENCLRLLAQKKT